MYTNNGLPHYNVYHHVTSYSYRHVSQATPTGGKVNDPIPLPTVASDIAILRLVVKYCPMTTSDGLYTRAPPIPVYHSSRVLTIYRIRYTIWSGRDGWAGRVGRFTVRAIILLF